MTTEHPFARAEALVLKLMGRSDLDYADRAVLLLLAFMSSAALPFAVEYTFIAKRTRLSVHTARRAMKRLEERGYITSTLALGVRFITDVRIEDPAP